MFPIPSVTGGAAGPSEASGTTTVKDIFNNPINIGGFKSNGSAGFVFPTWMVVGALALAGFVLWKKFGK